MQIVAFRKLEIEFSKLKLIFLALNCVLAFFFNKIGFLVQTIYQIILNGAKLFKSQLFSNLVLGGGRVVCSALRRTEFCGKGVVVSTLLELLGSPSALRLTGGVTGCFHDLLRRLEVSRWRRVCY